MPWLRVVKPCLTTEMPSVRSQRLGVLDGLLDVQPGEISQGLIGRNPRWFEAVVRDRCRLKGWVSGTLSGTLLDCPAFNKVGCPELSVKYKLANG